MSLILVLILILILSFIPRSYYKQLYFPIFWEREREEGEVGFFNTTSQY